MAPAPPPSGSLRPTRLGTAFLGLTLVTLVGCINYALGLGYAVTFLLAGVWVAAAAQALRVGRGLSGRVASPAAVVAGDTASFTVQLEGRGPGGAVLVRLGPGAEGLGRVPAGGLAEVSVPVPTPARGLLSFPRPAVAALDPLGLWAVWRPLPIPAPLPVAPRPEAGAPPPPDPSPGAGEETGRRGPGPDDFSGLRPYQPGDSPRQVSWRHAARLGTPVVRETDAPAGRVLALDWAQTAALPDGEARLSRLAAWVEGARRTGTPFCLTLPGRALPPGAGEAHAAAARAALAEVQPWPTPTMAPRRPRPAPLPGAPLRFALLALAFALAPAALRQPAWLTGLETGLLGYAALRTRRPHLPAPPSWMLGLLAGLGFVALNATYGTLLGREAGTALLGLLVTLKAAETRTRRDARLLALLGVFVLLTHLFFGQGPLAAAHVALGLVGLLAALGRWNGPDVGGRGALGGAARLAALGTPLMLALFLLFPRPDGPLWHLPVQAAQTGLANEITAGEYSELAQSRAVAFRAEFAGPLPPPEERYWRGPVYERYDGVRWEQVRERFGSPTLEFYGPALAYRLTLEPGNPPWIPVLDTPTTLPPGAFLTTAFQAVSFSVGASRTRHDVQGRAARLGVREAPERLSLNLGLPPQESPRARALAASWAALPAPERVEAALAWLRDGEFRYTLTPSALPGRDRVDAFLFGSRAGFCEHYASAFTFLMRAAGVPARVVGGYLGGERNPDGGYLIVRQQDAHAWAEVWLEGQGWVRVDPTAAVAPGRVTAGLPTALSRPEASTPPPPAPLEQAALRFDAWQTRWNSWVAGYDGPRQRDLLARLEAGVGGRPALLALGVAGALLAALPPLLVARRRSPAPDPAARLLDDLARRLRLPRAPGETASAYAERAAAHSPAQAQTLRRAAEAYHRARYGGDGAALAELRAAVRQVRG
ncbi:transglutaminase [Deinococcus sp. RL]|uniref:transglutaminaseTgpA domain-containing protein n=1 Tax=Deinococcus sp. RL TaxID=1489678 RepID=UPI0004D84394|nr:transglutaminaseTgpA domain-containing protein [Deinococcus sp. RL]KEF33414.1 transglutaminase [Deinococcus sp. RL]